MHHSAVGVNAADLAFEVSGLRVGMVCGLDATRPDLALSGRSCGWCQYEASDPVALSAGFVASSAGGVEVPVVAGAQCRGVGCAGAGGRRDTAAAGAGAVRGDAGGLGPPAAQPPAERAAGPEQGTAGPPVSGVHDGVAVGMDAGAGGGVERLGQYFSLGIHSGPGCEVASRFTATGGGPWARAPIRRTATIGMLATALPAIRRPPRAGACHAAASGPAPGPARTAGTRACGAPAPRSSSPGPTN